MILNNNNGYFAYMIQIAITLFYIAAAMGATIIVAKGDIFHSFRAWVQSKSKVNKVWVHVLVVQPNVLISEIIINGQGTMLGLDKKGLNSNDIDGLKYELSEYFGYVSIERTTDFQTKITVHTDSKVSISINTPLLFVTNNTFNSFDKYDTVKWIAFLHDMISCPQCCGVWIGMIWYCLYRFGANDTFLFNMLCAGCVVSLFASIYWKAHDLLNNYANKK